MGHPHPGPVAVWVMAARIPTLPAAVVPVLVGSASAVSTAGAFDIGAFLAALVASLLIQIGTNLANDLYDFKRGADTEARTGPVRVTHAGLLTPEQVARGTVVCFGLAFLVGLYLVFRGGWPILVVGLASIAAGVLYTAGPWPLAYIGLGDVFAFLFFGVIAVVGTHYVHALSVDPLAFVVSLPVGFLVTAILVVNNLRDIPTDAAAGKRTMAVRLGDRGARWEYALLVAGAYAVPLVLWVAGLRGPLILLPALSLVVSVPLLRTVLGGATGFALNPVLKGTGRLHLVFGLLLAAGLLWS
ncbi:MAG TPA: 1,4-dihydroxy-2-naphthoate polyprenyltransferase [Limnochordales bacterium]